MKLIPIFLIFCSCGFFDTKKTTKDPLYSAAEDAGFLKDMVVQKDMDKINKKIVSEKYIESLMVGRISASVSEVAEYYKKNKKQFNRKDDGALVLLFEKQNKNSAIKIKNTLERNSFDSERVSKTIQQYGPQRVFLHKKDLKPGLSDRVFKKTGGCFIVQRDTGFAVFYIINIFRAGTPKELADVSDGIQARILALKKHRLKEEIKDSLQAIYGGSYK